MKIVIDARSLSSPLTGIGRYTLEMSRALSMNNDLSLSLFSHKAPNEDIGKLKNLHFVHSNINSKIYKQFWAEAILPGLVKGDVFWGPAHFLPRMLPKNIARVVTIHDLVWKFAKQTMQPMHYWLEKFHMPFAVKNAHRVVADSLATAKDIEKEFKINPEKITVIPLGISNTYYPKNLIYVEDLGVVQKYFLFVGTLEPRKNLIRLLNAYANLPESIKQSASLVIVGGKGWGNLQLKEEIKRLDLLNFVKIIGYVSDEVLSALYANAMFLAMPSLYEGFGLPIIEAMTYGVPCLTSLSSSMPEVAGNAGILINPFDVKSIENGLIRLITDQILLDGLRKKAIENAKRFNWSSSAEKLLKVFQQACIISKNKR